MTPNCQDRQKRKEQRKLICYVAKLDFLRLVPFDIIEEEGGLK